MDGKETGASNEMLACFDGQGSPIEPLPRGIACTDGSRQWHAVSNIWLVNGKAQILCTQRSFDVRGNPGKWQSYLGGHVKAGSDFIETATSELEEEVGLKISPKDLKLIEKGRYEPWMHFYESYACFYRGELKDLKFNDGEVIGAKWYNMDEYWQERTANPESWCNPCLPANQEEIKRWIRTL